MFRRSCDTLTATMLLGAVVLLVTGCGGDSNDPLDPSDKGTPPPGLSAPHSMAHTTVVAGDYVSWWPPAGDDADDVVEYSLYQFTPDPSQFQSYVEIARVRDAHYIFASGQVTVGESYTLRVRAVNARGTEGDWSEPFTFVAEGPRTGGGKGMQGGTPDQYGGDPGMQP